MFSDDATTARTRSGTPRSAIAQMPATTAAPPDMSPFMSSMPSDGLSEMPPVSNVIALADEAERDVRLRARGLVAHDDQARVVVRALRDAGEGAHPELDDLLAAERLDLDAFGRELRRALGEPLGRQLVRRRVREIAGVVRPFRDLCRARGRLRSRRRRAPTITRRSKSFRSPVSRERHLRVS